MNVHIPVDNPGRYGVLVSCNTVVGMITQVMVLVSCNTVVGMISQAVMGSWCHATQL